MTLDYQDHHCKMCGKYDKFAWVNGGYCNDCLKLRNLMQEKLYDLLEETHEKNFG